jgi:quercetin dioxygenase-like cupin family protein
MSVPSFDEFSARSHAEGFEEVLVREWAPGQQVGMHTHPFAVKALVVRGEVWLQCGDETTHVPAGQGFELARGLPHAERYGAEGATFWVARRNAT